MIWTPERQDAALATARHWQSTPHRDNCAIHGVGIDCIHLVHEILVGAGIMPRVKLPRYNPKEGQFHRSDRLKFAVLGYLHAEEVPVDAPEFGDVCVFQTGTQSSHVGFYADGHIWHSLAGLCVTRSDWKLWRHELDSLLRLTAVGVKERAA